MLGLTSALNLIELARPDNPLLQYILQNAGELINIPCRWPTWPNRPADAIGADALLARAGALYHDAGKHSMPSSSSKTRYLEKWMLTTPSIQ